MPLLFAKAILSSAAQQYPAAAHQLAAAHSLAAAEANFKTLQQHRLAHSDICVVTGTPICLGCSIIIGIAVTNDKSAAAQVSGIARPEHVRQQLSNVAVGACSCA